MSCDQLIRLSHKKLIITNEWRTKSIARISRRVRLRLYIDNTRSHHIHDKNCDELHGTFIEPIIMFQAL